MSLCWFLTAMYIVVAIDMAMNDAMMDAEWKSSADDVADVVAADVAADVADADGMDARRRDRLTMMRKICVSLGSHDDVGRVTSVAEISNCGSRR